MVKKTAEEAEKSVEEAEQAQGESGTSNPVLEPDKSKMPEPGTTPDTEHILNTDQAKSLSPNVTVSGTKPDGEGGQVLLDTVDPAVANAALLGPAKAAKPQRPSDPPENEGRVPREGEVRFKCEADNQPWFSGGAMKAGETYIMSKEEAELLTQTKAGRIEGASPQKSNQEAGLAKPAPKAAKGEGPEAA